jgi:alpha-glucosidase
MADAGYDVADYRAVEPRFGTLAEAEALIDEAHARGLRVLLDIVPNHTSSEHPWFREAVPRAPARPARARYLFRPGRGPAGDLPPNDWRSVFGGARVDPGHRARRPAGRVVPAPVRPRPARRQLGAAGGARGLRRHPAVLVRPRGGRVPHRRRALADQGTGPARRRPGAGRRSGSRWTARWCGPRGPRTRTGTATRCTRSTGSGASWPTPTTRRGCSSPRRGWTSRSGSPATSAATSCTPRSTSTTWSARGRARRCAGPSRRPWPSTSPSGPPPTWVLSNHDVARHVSRYAGSTSRPPPAASAARTAVDLAVGTRRARAAVLLTLGPARRGLRLPGRGAGPAGGRGPARGRPAGPHLGALRAHRPRPRRLPGADPVVRRRAAVRLRLRPDDLAAAAGPTGVR